MTTSELLAEGEARRRAGDDAGALSSFLAAARSAHGAFEPELEARAMLAAGELRALADDLAGARDALEQAVGRAMEAGSRSLEADAHVALANLYFDHGLSKDGHDALLEAMALYRDDDSRDGKLKLARTVRLYGEHIGVLGGEAEARQALELARIMFVDLGEDEAARGVEEDLRLLSDYAR